MQKFFLKIVLFLMVFHVAYAYDHCPDLAAHEDYSQWTVLSGPISGREQFYMVLTRGTPGFTAVTLCKYDSGNVTLYRLGRALPINPMIWRTFFYNTLDYNSCGLSPNDCGFNLVS